MQDPVSRWRSFLRELQRRKVYRVAAIYAASAFVLVQAADLLLRGLGAPAWGFSAVVVLAILGFPVALVLAWAYEIRPEGVRRTDEASGPTPVDGGVETAELSTGHVVFRYGLAVVAVAAVGYASLTFGGVLGSADAAVIRSLAVLPPDNLSADADQEYFVAGMHDAIIGELAQVPGLRVISRTSAMRYLETDKSAPEIARELGVDALVEGSVFRTGDSVRIQMQLIGARPEERHVWARAYQRELGHVLRIHGDVAREIAREIAIELTPDVAARLAASRPVDPEAYEAYLRGRFHLDKFTPEGFDQGMAWLNRALEADPADPLPWAGIALGWSLIGHGPEPPEDAFDRAEAAAARALELDSLASSGSTRSVLAETWEALAEVRLYSTWDWAAAQEAFDRALELNPNLAAARAHQAWLHVLHGRTDASLADMQRARELDPLNPLWPAWRGWLLWSFGRLDEATAEARRSLELDPEFPVGLYVLGGVQAERERFDEAIASQRKAAEASPAWRWALGVTLAEAGRTEEARELAARLAEDPGPIDTWGLAEIHAVLGNEDEAFRWLERGFEVRFSWIPWIEWNHNLAPLRDDPRFAAMIERLDLPDVPDSEA